MNVPEGLPSGAVARRTTTRALSSTGRPMPNAAVMSVAVAPGSTALYAKANLVASNAAARRLSPHLVPGRNQVRDLLTSPDDRALHPDHEAVTACLVGNLRQAAVSTARHAASALASELAVVSERFRTLWERHDVQGQRGGTVRFHHPLLGDLTLDRDRLAIDGTDGLSLVVLHATAGGPDAARLAELTR